MLFRRQSMDGSKKEKGVVLTPQSTATVTRGQTLSNSASCKSSQNPLDLSHIQKGHVFQEYGLLTRKHNTCLQNPQGMWPLLLPDLSCSNTSNRTMGSQRPDQVVTQVWKLCKKPSWCSRRFCWTAVFEQWWWLRLHTLLPAWLRTMIVMVKMMMQAQCKGCPISGWMTEWTMKSSISLSAWKNLSG